MHEADEREQAEDAFARYVLPELEVLARVAFSITRSTADAEHLEDCHRCGLEAEVYTEIKTALGERDRTVDPRAIERLRHFGEQLARGGSPAHGDPGA